MLLLESGDGRDHWSGQRRRRFRISSVPSLIFTLAMNSVVRGLIIMSGGRTIENFGGAISSYGNKTVFAGVTLYYAIAVVLVAISHLALTKTRKGKYFIAVGDNAGGANLVGTPVLGRRFWRMCSAACSRVWAASCSPQATVR